MSNHPRFEMLEKIASGSFATVYRGRDLELNREIAIKQIHEQYLEEPQQLDRYWHEAQLLASFQHPNIVTIYDIVRERGWLILELMQGNLSRVCGRKSMDLNALRTTLAHSLRALKFLHAHGIVHGDIKPSNLMIDRRRRVKIGDFGLARRVSDDEGSLIKGTTKYMAPEVVSEEFGTIGPASDLYSLGFTAYELMCGENFESLFPGMSAFGRDKQIAWMMWHAAPDRRLPEIARVLEGVPPDLAKVIQKLTAKPQSQRYATADEALSDLNIDVKLVRSGEEGDVTQSITQAMTRPGPVPDRKRRWLAIGAFAASLLMCLIVLLVPGGNQPAGPVSNAVAGNTGVIREVMVRQNRIILEDDEGVPSEIDVGEKPRIRLNEEKYILLRDLQPGDQLTVRHEQDTNGQPLVVIQALRPAGSRGHIKRLNVADNEVLLAIDDAAVREDVPLRVVKGTKITLNGKTASLQDLQVGDHIEAAHLKDLQGRAARVATRLDALRIIRLTAFVHDVDVARNRLTVELRGGRDAQRITLNLDKHCELTLDNHSAVDGHPVALGDLKRGDRVTLRHDVMVSEITAHRRQHAAGVLMADEVVDRRLRVRVADGKEVEYRVATDCEVNLGRQPATLDDLRKYDHVELTYDAAGGGEPVVKTVDAARPVKADRLAIIIGVQNYNDRRLSRLRYVADDAELLHDTLVNRYACAPERVLLLASPTRQELEHAVRDWLRKSSNLTQVLVYFAGHAYSDETGRMYLAPRDLDWQNLSETGLPVEWLAEELQRTPAREKMLILDTSHSGHGADLDQQPSPGEIVESLRSAADGRLPLDSVALLGSCSKGETGAEWEARNHGLFAEVLSEGFGGRADRDRNLQIGPQELFDYLQRRMMQSPEEGQPRQVPVLSLP